MAFTSKKVPKRMFLCGPGREVSHHTSKISKTVKLAKTICKPSHAKNDHAARQRDPFRLLNLPAELREMVFEQAAHKFTAVLREEASGQLINDSRLMRVSRQVHAEFSNALCLTRPKLVVHVHDLDFTHLIVFLNKLSAGELASLPTMSPTTTFLVRASAISTIQIRIYLLADNAVSEHAPLDIAELELWIRRCGNATKTGNQVNFTYIVYSNFFMLGSREDSGPRGSENAPKGVDSATVYTLRQEEFVAELDGHGALTESDARISEERVKLILALKSPLPISTREEDKEHRPF
ncbi:hypothetical protein LTR97_011717 [Elasticomyces elasticus]|uniref:F-box domain-containing protein n=1 Tax=Elasticomyces elasticus TaxID=574655 RepID=A0AAN7VMF2_9PEZI|nr:hypothetical protein LTR97_011717 [Elasticomyces elasticus]